MISPEVKDYIDKQITESQQTARYSTTNASMHTHNNIDSPNIVKFNPITNSISIGGATISAGTGIVFTAGTTPAMIVVSGGGGSSIAGRSYGGGNTLLSSGLDGRKVNLANNAFASGITWDATGFGFVCVTAGYYQVNGGILLNGGVSVGDILVCNINVNGTTVSSNFFHANNAAQSMLIADIVHLNVSDEVFLFAGDNSGHDVTYNASSQYTFLSIASV